MVKWWFLCCLPLLKWLHILPIQIEGGKREERKFQQFDILFSPDYGGYYQHSMSISSLLWSWVHWNLGCPDHLHESSCICWFFEVISSLDFLLINRVQHVWIFNFLIGDRVKTSLNLRPLTLIPWYSKKEENKNQHQVPLLHLKLGLNPHLMHEMVTRFNYVSCNNI